MLPGRTVFVTCAVAFACTTPAAAQTYTYVVLGAQGAVARIIVPAGASGVVPQCPPIMLDGAPQEMKVRARPDKAFDILVCEYLLNPLPAKASIAGDPLPLPPAALKSIAVFGDTGCRIKAETASPEEMAHDTDEEEAEQEKGKPKVQDCKSATKWPFKTMSKTIANAEPNLVVHVGDYHYRESPCPPGYEQDCGGSAYGDIWKAWQEDFFDPAKPLLGKAPWIVTRGNHEICDRAGVGYARLLDPRPADGKTPECEEFIPHYTVTVGGRSFIELDSTEASDGCPCDVKRYTKQFETMQALPGTWLVTHRPIWGFTNSDGKLGIRNLTLQAALKPWKGRTPPGIELVLSGHIHLWEALSFEDKRSPQFVLGTGGTKRSNEITENLKGEKIGGTEVKAAKTDHEFGYTMFTPSQSGSHWNATYYDVDGNKKFACDVERTTIDCK
jgi:calcineurin-like phosphoesterase family protein